MHLESVGEHQTGRRKSDSQGRTVLTLVILFFPFTFAPLPLQGGGALHFYFFTTTSNPVGGQCMWCRPLAWLAPAR